jgi:hypothetical protein
MRAEKSISGLNVSGDQTVVTGIIAVPEAVASDRGPSKAGPEILPVPPDEAWFGLMRLIKTSFRTRICDVWSSDRSHRYLKLAAGTNTLIDVDMRPADPAGVEVTVGCSSGAAEWWPTIIMKQIKAELGLAEYLCLPESPTRQKQRAPTNGLLVNGARTNILNCLESNLAWQLMDKHEGMGCLTYRVWEGSTRVAVTIVVSPETDGNCRVYVRQGPMNTPGKPVIKAVFDLLKIHGFSPINHSTPT